MSNSSGQQGILHTAKQPHGKHSHQLTHQRAGSLFAAYRVLADKAAVNAQPLLFLLLPVVY
jgi:hypothetical protein